MLCNHWCFRLFALTVLLLPQISTADELSISLDPTGGVSLTLVRIPGGRFVQGSPLGESGREAAERTRQVTITSDFLLGTTEVTVGQFRRFVEATGYRTEAETGQSGGYGVEGGQLVQKPGFTWKNPGYQQTDQHPVTIVTWGDAQAFLKWLSSHSGRRVFLPSEAQWEYACRAGTTTRFSSGDQDAQLEQIAWSQAQSVKCPAAVGQKSANAFGLFDMSGNVYEWCQDAFNDYDGTEVTDPLQLQGQETLRYVLRGGSWMRAPKRCRSAARYRATAGTRNAENGFRVAADLAAASAVTDQARAATEQAADVSQAADGPEATVTQTPGEPAVLRIPGVPPLELHPSKGVWAVGSGPSKPSFRTFLRAAMLLVAVLFVVFVILAYWTRSSRRVGSRGQQQDGQPPFDSGPLTHAVPNHLPPLGGFRVEADGFWIPTAAFDIGCLLEVCYDAYGERQRESVVVSSHPEQFFYTGELPFNIVVQLQADPLFEGLPGAVGDEIGASQIGGGAGMLPIPNPAMLIPSSGIPGTMFPGRRADERDENPGPAGFAGFPPAY